MCDGVLLCVAVWCIVVQRVTVWQSLMMGNVCAALCCCVVHCGAVYYICRCDVTHFLWRCFII